MATTILLPSMNLTIPTPSIAPGPEWAALINAVFAQIAVHTHVPGQGEQVTPTGININTDMTFNANNATTLRSVRFLAQSSPLGASSDIGCIYVAGVDMYFNDGNGNQIRITQLGGVSGTPGSITGLASPASATYVAGTDTFIWQSAVNTPANLDCASIILRNLTAGSNGLTLSPPAALGTNYAITLPPLPVAQNFVTLDASGNMSAPWNVDNSTIVITANLLQVGPATQTAISQAAPAGVIVMTGSASAVAGWLQCDGTSYLRATYPALFAAISTNFGAVDSTHFNVPDLRGKFARGVSGTTNNDPDKATRGQQGTGGNIGNNVGSIQSFALQDHSHTFSVSCWNGQNLNGPTPQGQHPAIVCYNTGTSGASGQTSSETRPINVYVNYIIKT